MAKPFLKDYDPRKKTFLHIFKKNDDEWDTETTKAICLAEAKNKLTNDPKKHTPNDHSVITKMGQKSENKSSQIALLNLRMFQK